MSLKRKIDKQLGKGYYDTILKMGVVAGIPAKRLAKEMETTVANIEAMKREYRDELADLKVHKVICDQIFEELHRIRMTKMQMKLMDQVDDMLDFHGEDSLKPKDRVDLLKFLTKQLQESAPERGQSAHEDIPQEEVEERALRLLKGRA